MTENESSRFLADSEMEQVNGGSSSGSGKTARIANCDYTRIRMPQATGM